MPEITPWIAPVLTTVGVIVVAWTTGRFNLGAKRIERTIPSYAEMARTVTETQARLDLVESKLDEERTMRRQFEDRIDHLENDRRHDRAWITRTIRKVIDHDPSLAHLLLPWPGWYESPPTIPSTPN